MECPRCFFASAMPHKLLLFLQGSPESPPRWPPGFDGLARTIHGHAKHAGVLAGLVHRLHVSESSTRPRSPEIVSRKYLLNYSESDSESYANCGRPK